MFGDVVICLNGSELLAQAPAIPLAQYQWVNVIGPNVGNYQFHLVWGPLADQTWVR